PLATEGGVRAARGQRGLDPVLDAGRLLRRRHLDAGSKDGCAEEAQEPGLQAGTRVGLREVHAQAASRHRQEGRLPVRRVVQENHGLEAQFPGFVRKERLAPNVRIDPLEGCVWRQTCGMKSTWATASTR